MSSVASEPLGRLRLGPDRVVRLLRGRAAPLARRLGAKRHVTDRLVCSWVHGRARSSGRGVGLTTVEAISDGWWYTAPLPEERRVLAFLTDADLPAARIAHLGIRL